MICGPCRSGRGGDHGMCVGSPWCACHHVGATAGPPYADGEIRHAYMVGTIVDLPRTQRDLEATRLRLRISSMGLRPRQVAERPDSPVERATA